MQATFTEQFELNSRDQSCIRTQDAEPVVPVKLWSFQSVELSDYLHAVPLSLSFHHCSSLNVTELARL